MFVPLQPRYTSLTRAINRKSTISNALRLQTYNVYNNKKIVITNVEASIVVALPILPTGRDLISLPALNYYTVIAIVLRQQLAIVRIILSNFTVSASFCPQSLRLLKQLLLYSYTYSRYTEGSCRYSRQYSYWCRTYSYSQRYQKLLLNQSNSIELAFAELLELLVLLVQRSSNAYQRFVVLYSTCKDIPNRKALIASFYRSKSYIRFVLRYADYTIRHYVANSYFELYVSEVVNLLGIRLLQEVPLVIQFIAVSILLTQSRMLTVGLLLVRAAYNIYSKPKTIGIQYRVCPILFSSSVAQATSTSGRNYFTRQRAGALTTTSNRSLLAIADLLVVKVYATTITISTDMRLSSTPLLLLAITALY